MTLRLTLSFIIFSFPLLGHADLYSASAALSRGDYNTAAKEFKRLAEQGDAKAQANLGYMYYVGEGLPQSYEEAAKWYRKAAVQGDKDAQYNLAVAYSFGEGIKQNYKEAALWYRRAAEQGHIIAQYSLGLSYSFGEGVRQDSQEAAKWFRKAAEQGYARAQVQLGSKYHTGDGVPQDYLEAVKWYRMAADRGNAAAQYNLGSMYRSGKGVKQDYNQALRWFRLAADQGYAAAQNELASIERALAGASRTRSTPQLQPAPVTRPQSPVKKVETPAVTVTRVEAQAGKATGPVPDTEKSDLLSLERGTQKTGGPETAEEQPLAVTGSPAQTEIVASDTVEERAPGEIATTESVAKPKRRKGIRGFFSKLFGKKTEPAEPITEDNTMSMQEEAPATAVEEQTTALQNEDGGASTATEEQPATAQSTQGKELLAMDNIDQEAAPIAVDAEPGQPVSTTVDDGDIPLAHREENNPTEIEPWRALESDNVITYEETEAEKKPGRLSRFFGNLFSKHRDTGEEAIVETEPESQYEPVETVPEQDNEAAASDMMTPEGAGEESPVTVATEEAPPPKKGFFRRLFGKKKQDSDEASGTAAGADTASTGAAQEITREGTDTASEEDKESAVAYAADIATPTDSPIPLGETSPDQEPVNEDTADTGNGAGETEQNQSAVKPVEENTEQATGTAEQTKKRSKFGFFRKLFGKSDAGAPRENSSGDINEETVAMVDESASTPATGQEQAAIGEVPAARADPALFQAAMDDLDKQDYDEAFLAFHSLAAQGDAAAQYQLGSLYYQGLGTRQDYNEAAIWYRRSADQGNVDAQYSLGNMFLMGEGIQQDDKQAGYWYKKAAAQGHVSAQHNLESIQRVARTKSEEIAEGEVDENQQEEVDSGGVETASTEPGKKKSRFGFFKKLFGKDKNKDTGEQSAATPEPVETTAREQAHGEDGQAPEVAATSENETERPAAEEKTATAPGAEHEGKKRGFFGRLFGRKVEQETEDKQASEDVEARISEENKSKASQAVSDYERGLAYSFADNGTSADSAAAFKWFKKSAEQGYAPAQYKVGVAYAYGEGVERDPLEAAKWYRMAAGQGYAIAQRNLGIMYMKGDGVDQDKSLALAWYSILAENGNVMDIRRRDILEKELSESERERARQLKDKISSYIDSNRNKL
ncbi:MAG: hypothetical protein ACE5GZ_01970 [Gammaproteobacteria bacterium]